MKIILVTMVRNEARIIARMLASALPFVDAVFIADTGSTDGTAEIATEFVGQKLPISVRKHMWMDFSHNRNAALCGAQVMADDLGWDENDDARLLLLDADHVLRVKDGFKRETLPDVDGIRLYQEEPTMRYPNMRLIKASARVRYVGRTHEYLSLDGTQADIADPWIEDKNDGGCKADKFTRDIDLLLLDWADSKSGRTAFYLGQTYWALRQYENAIDWYRRRIAMAQAHEMEEAWYARLAIGRCLLELGDAKGAKGEFLSAFGDRPWRAEPLHDLAKIELDAMRHAQAHALAKLGMTIPMPEHEGLFVEKNVYQWELRRDMAIAACYVGDRDAGALQAEILRLKRGSPYREEALKHASFYVQRLPCAIQDVPFTPPPGWHACNPSIVKSELGYLINVRCVNYRITPGHVYEIDGGIVKTRNFLLETDHSFQPVTAAVELETPAGCGGPIQDLEDLRIYHVDGDAITGLANRSDWAPCPNGRLMPRMKRCRWTLRGALLSSESIDISPPERCEKNWLPFVVAGQHHAVYWYEPFTIISLDRRQPIQTQEFDGLDLSGFRGSAGPIAWPCGWLFVVHEVCERDVDGKRLFIYLHRFCWMTMDGQLRRFSGLFNFGIIGVEFCCGIAPHPDGAVLTFGMNDTEAKLAVVTTETIERGLAANTIR